MDFSHKFSELIEKRMTYECDIDYENNSVIKNMVQLLTQNIDRTILFLDEESSEEQMIWLSEIMDDAAEDAKSKDFIEACYRLAKHYPETAEKYNIMAFIDSAAEYVE